MSIDFIQQRMAHLDSYLKGIDSKFVSKIGLTDSVASNGQVNFDAVLNNFIEGPKATKSVQAVVKNDDFSKLPDNFDSYIKNTTSEINQRFHVNISPNLVKSVIKQESGFNPEAKSHAGAQGLMQLMPSTAKTVGVFNTMNPYQNVKGGITYLAKMLKQFDGDVQKSLAAYNAGPNAVEKYGGIPPYPETQNYVESIMRDFLGRENNYQSYDMIG